MAEPLLKTSQNSPSRNTSLEQSSLKIVDDTMTDELIIALCAPIGVSVKIVSKEIEAIMKGRGYIVEIIKVSEIIEDLCNELDFSFYKDRKDYDSILLDPSSILKDQTKKLERKKLLIYAGNLLRKDKGVEFLAEKAIADIFQKREKAKKTDDPMDYRSNRFCYIIDSLKSKFEYDLLKKVYSKLFYMVGVYTDEDVRLSNLDPSGGKSSFAQDLIDIDSKENDDNGKNIKWGQNVRGLFPLSDFFLDITSETDQTNSLARLFDLIFGTRIHTPHDDEKAMYAAWSAGLNSACLSRQVGACLTDCEGNIIGTGWNDVPVFGGGVYHDIRKNSSDFRCYNLPLGNLVHCRNDNEKREISKEISASLVDLGYVDIKKIDEVTQLLLESRLGDLIEFSRAVHAEMNCLFDGLAKSPGSVKGGKIYVTTYPCHNCARHIVLAGVVEVYFIEPYPKSKALKLHRDSLTKGNEMDKVRLKPFKGVSPTRYIELFSTTGRELKNNGILELPKSSDAALRYGISLDALWNLEKKIASKFGEKLAPQSSTGTSVNEK